MKKIFFFLFPLFLIKASAQQPYYDFKKFKKDKEGSFVTPFDKRISEDSLQKKLKKILHLQEMQTMGRLIFTQTNGTKVYSLPTDNMSCIVPDLSQYNYNMPNAAKGATVNVMPPGSIPQRKIPQKQ